ncbi:lipoprotein [Spiroplasma taiwanense]
MKKLITIMTMFLLTATPVLSVVSCNEREAPNMGTFII